MNPESFEAGGSSDVKVMKGYTYIWNNTSVTTNENYQINKDGKYWVQIRDATGNTSLPSKSIARGEADEDETAVQPVNYKNISIYPDLVKEALFINYPSEKDAFSISLYNMQGSMVKQAKYNVVAGLNRYTLNIPELASGVYLIKCVIDSETFMRKIIVSN